MSQCPEINYVELSDNSNDLSWWWEHEQEEVDLWGDLESDETPSMGNAMVWALANQIDEIVAEYPPGDIVVFCGHADGIPMIRDALQTMDCIQHINVCSDLQEPISEDKVRVMIVGADTTGITALSSGSFDYVVDSGWSPSTDGISCIDATQAECDERALCASQIAFRLYSTESYNSRK